MLNILMQYIHSLISNKIKAQYAIFNQFYFTFGPKINAQCDFNYLKDFSNSYQTRIALIRQV